MCPRLDVSGQTPHKTPKNPIGGFSLGVILRRFRPIRSKVPLKALLIFRGNDHSPTADIASTTTFQSSLRSFRDVSDADRGNEDADKSPVYSLHSTTRRQYYRSATPVRIGAPTLSTNYPQLPRNFIASKVRIIRCSGSNSRSSTRHGPAV